MITLRQVTGMWPTRGQSRASSQTLDPLVASHELHPLIQFLFQPLSPNPPQMVLYGAWPTLLVGSAVTWWWLRRRLANAAKFQDPNIDKSKLRKVYRFANPGQ